MTDGLGSPLSRAGFPKWNRGIQPNERKCLANSGGIGNTSPVQHWQRFHE